MPLLHFGKTNGLLISVALLPVSGECFPESVQGPGFCLEIWLGGQLHTHGGIPSTLGSLSWWRPLGTMLS